MQISCIYTYENKLTEHFTNKRESTRNIFGRLALKQSNIS